MKRLLMILVLVCTTVGAMAQTDDMYMTTRRSRRAATEEVSDTVKSPVSFEGTYRHYCSVVVSISMKKGFEALIDLGTDSREDVGDIASGSKKLRFTSEMSVINYMQRLGWELAQFAEVSAPGMVKAVLGQSARDVSLRTYYMYKEVSSIEDIRRGLTIIPL